MSRDVYTVSGLNAYIKNVVDSDIYLSDVMVRGEISNFKYHSSGHMYFTLKDENSKVKAVMFKTYNLFLKFRPEDGMNVIISGYISVYDRDGQYQLYCSKMEPDGIGSLYLAFEQLKERLYNAGYFDDERKKQIPLLPGRIGVATSPTGAVIRDIINVSTKRFPRVNIVLYPVKVQGDGAAESIVKAMEYFNRRGDIDVIIIGRGGGSIEELWAFNEEIVAEAVYKSHIPVISAVGHETDFTIADFTADVRASTPSHAAEIAVPSKEELSYRIESLAYTINSVLKSSIAGSRYKCGNLLQTIDNFSPVNVVNRSMQLIDNLQDKLNYNMTTKLNYHRNKYSILVNRIDGLSPLKVISRGYAYVEAGDSVVKRVKQLEEGEVIKVHMQDGTASCRVENISEDMIWEIR